jgi:hypothetical protein
MIDISVETPAALRLAAQFLFDHATLREAMEGATNVPTGTQAAAPTVPASTSVPTAAPNLSPETATAIVPPPPSNVVPFVPPAPTSAPSVPTPDTSSTSAVGSPVGAPVPPAASGAPPVVEFDSAGVPYDARIHQKKRSVKKDGTWKLQKGIADSLVAAVMAELAPRISKPTPAAPPAPPADVPPAGFGTTPLPVGASPAPVSLPPVPPIPPVTGGPQGVGSPVAPPAPPAEGIAETQDPFRALISKISEARKAGKLSAEEPTQAAASAGAPNLQALNAMPHLIPKVEAYIDALLLTR